MKSILSLFLAVLLILAAGPLAAAPQAAPQVPATGQVPAASVTKSGNVQGAVFLGSYTNDNTGELTRLAPFDVAKQGTLPQMGLQLWGQSGGTRFELAAFNGGHARDQRYAGRLNVNRYLKASVSYDRFNNRTQHDPLSYMDSAIATFVVRHDDLDPTGRYSNAHGVLDARVELTTPGFAPLKLFASHRSEMRDGHRQGLTTSHCANCHTTANGRALNESTRDMVAGASLQFSRFSLEGTVSSRKFKDEAATPSILYDKAVHPQTAADVFVNRVVYDSRSGVLPYDQVSATTKTSQSLRARLDLPKDIVATGSYTHSKTKNDAGAFGADYSGGMGQVVVPLGPRATLRAVARRYSLDADSVAVELAEPVAPAGPSAGLTYAQAYPALGAVDFVRESTLSRTPTEASVELSYRPWKKTALRAEYGYEQINRTYSEVETTKTNRVLLSGRTQLHKTLNARFRVDQRWTSDPFTNRTAAIPTAYQLFVSPNNQPFGGQQYFTMYHSRVADLTGLPTSHFTAEEALTWSPTERVAVSAHYRLKQASNNDLNYSKWKQSLHMPGAEIYYAAGDRVTLTAGYAYQRERTETLFTTLAFVG